MTGEVLYRPTARDVHECQPPMRCAVYRSRADEPADDCWAPVFERWQDCDGWHSGNACMNREAAEPIGAVWRCGECGTYWTVWLPKNHPQSRLIVEYRPEWRRATWWERRRARREHQSQ